MFDLYRGKDFTTDMCPWLKNYLEYTEAAVVADKGVAPAQIPDLKGIEGDDNDHYPGVRNVSSAATPLLKEYGSVEGIYAAIDVCGGDPKEEKALSVFWKIFYRKGIPGYSRRRECGRCNASNHQGR